MSGKRGIADSLVGGPGSEPEEGRHEAVVAALRDARVALAELRASLER